MRYGTINEMVKGIAKTVIHHGLDGSIGYWQGIDNFKSDPIKEMANLYSVCPMIKSKDVLALETISDQPWAEDHFQERINPRNHKEALNPGYSYKYWPHATFKDKGDSFVKEIKEYKELEVAHEEIKKRKEDKVHIKFSHTYMERFWPTEKNGIRFKMGNWGRFIENARKNPNSRQLYFPIFFPEDTEASYQGERTPCSLGYHFQVFHGYLHLSYFIRSCDLQKHFRNDIYFTMRLAQELKEQVPEYKNIPLGNLNIWVGNLHAFVNDIWKIKKWMK